MPKKTEKNPAGFEEELKRLEEIVGQLEAGIPIEESLGLYEEGLKLSGKLEKSLGDIERKVFEVKNISKLVKEEDTSLDMDLFK